MIVTVSVRETGPKTVTIMNQTILECHKEGFRLGRKYRTGYRDRKTSVLAGTSVTIIARRLPARR
jgi:hypothetical protein